MENINIFDIVVLSLVALLGLKGLLRGFIKEIFALVGLIGGVFIASRIALDVGEFIDNVIPMNNNNTVLLLGFIVSLIGIWAIAYIAGTILGKMFSLSGLGIFDRLLGFVFGAGKVFFLFSIIIYAAFQIEVFKNKLNEKLSDSFTLPILYETGNFIIQLDTVELTDKVTNTIDSAIEATKETIINESINATLTNAMPKETIDEK